VLEKGEGNHAKQGVMMKAMPRAPFEVIEAELLLHLLMHLLARPASLDR
jgi:hypothetical protein